jgi:hypothetical protein
MVIHLVNKKRVVVLERFPHTAIVRFMKTGNELNIKLDLIKQYIPKKKHNTQYNTNT